MPRPNAAPPATRRRPRWRVTSEPAIRRSTFALFFALTACGESKQEQPIAGRWYTGTQVEVGRSLFRANCASCHGQQAEGTADWKQRLPDGSFPPPPLNGTAHAWHHSLDVLRRTVQNGGVPLGGTMPGFKGKLSARETDAVIAYFQSQWSQQVYDAWLNMGGLQTESAAGPR